MSRVTGYRGRVRRALYITMIVVGAAAVTLAGLGVALIVIVNTL